MPALSFGIEWLDPLLRSEKRQTTRPETTRIKAGDIVNIYIQQRRRILNKPLRRMTHAGIDKMCERGYPMVPAFHQAAYPAHFIGVVEIAEVYPLCFCDLSPVELEVWALADGFPDTRSAEAWFVDQHGCDYPADPYTVIGWDCWLERYFSAGALKIVAGGD